LKRNVEVRWEDAFEQNLQFIKKTSNCQAALAYSAI